jgi:alpha-L-arabinofuranosidase
MNRVAVDCDYEGARINRNIYGHFAEHLGRGIYEGIAVREDSTIPNVRGIRNDVVEALRRIHVPVLRWPGGCFADEYHWRDGIGPLQDRPTMINTHWGGVTEDNSFGTHEFLDLCTLIGADPYVCGNVGSGAVAEMQQWVEYITFNGRSPMADLRRANGRDEPWPLPYFGVGNEPWGCGGSLQVEYYANLYRRYQSYVRNLGGNTVFKIAAGAQPDDEHWTEVMMRDARGCMDGLSLHYYTVPGPDWEHKGSATDFGEREWFTTLKKCLQIDAVIRRHASVMDRFDPEKRVALIIDEWGAWYDVEPGTNPGFLYQQNTLRDALIAALSLHVFNNHCERVRMANLAQTVNVLQAVLLTDGAHMVKTPTYHVFDLLKGHQGAVKLPCQTRSAWYDFEGEQIPQLSASASRDDSGRLLVTMCNVDPHREAAVECDMWGAEISEATGTILTADRMQAHNTFEQPGSVMPAPFDIDRQTLTSIRLVLPPMSVVALRVRIA